MHIDTPKYAGQDGHNHQNALLHNCERIPFQTCFLANLESFMVDTWKFSNDNKMVSPCQGTYFFVYFYGIIISSLITKLAGFVISTHCSCFNDNSSIKNIFLSQLFLFLYFYFFVNSKQLFTNFVGFSNASQHIFSMENPL